MFSLSRSKAGVISRLADYLQFRLNPNKTDFVAGQRGVGGPSASQTQLGIFYPTVQGAIDDLVGRCDLPVNSVVINTDGLPPGFTNQTDQLKFSGIVQGTPGSEQMIYVLGFPVKVVEGDTDIAVAAKAHAVLTDAVVNSIAISSVEIDSTDSTVLNITYNDYQTHIYQPVPQYGISITQTIVVEGKAGYGNWARMGTVDQTLTGGEVDGNITLYYFRRES